MPELATQQPLTICMLREQRVPQTEPGSIAGRLVGIAGRQDDRLGARQRGAPLRLPLAAGGPRHGLALRSP